MRFLWAFRYNPLRGLVTRFARQSPMQPGLLRFARNDQRGNSKAPRHCEGPYSSFLLLQEAAPKQSSMKEPSEFLDCFAAEAARNDQRAVAE
jgi:hypothetical protein